MENLESYMYNLNISIPGLESHVTFNRVIVNFSFCHGKCKNCAKL